MNKKGFTLIEVIASLAIIAVILLLIFPTIENYNKNLREKAYTAKIDEVLEAADSWGNDNINLLSSNCHNITIGILINGAYIYGDNENKTILINPITNESMNNMQICVKYLFDNTAKKYYIKTEIVD